MNETHIFFRFTRLAFTFSNAHLFKLSLSLSHSLALSQSCSLSNSGSLSLSLHLAFHFSTFCSLSLSYSLSLLTFLPNPLFGKALYYIFFSFMHAFFLGIIFLLFSSYLFVTSCLTLCSSSALLVKSALYISLCLSSVSWQTLLSFFKHGTCFLFSFNWVSALKVLKLFSHPQWK